MRVAAAACALVVAVAQPRPAGAYEYEVRARTLGQFLQLPSFRVGGGVTWLSRRRVTQTLALDLDDLGDLEAARRKAGRTRPGPRVRFTSYLRFDHDLGDWTAGTVRWPQRAAAPLDAVDAIPELAQAAMTLDLPYAVLTVEDLGPLDLAIGRQVRYGAFDAWALDGVTVTLDAPGPLALEVSGGWRVRGASPWATDRRELDGTTGADCREFVEGPTPGSGSWQLVDRGRVVSGSAFTADLDLCPQREAASPAVEVAASTDGLRGLHARLAYRRTASPTVGLIGAVDRLDQPDLGLYPGGLSGWGVDEEHVSVSAEAAVALPGGGRLSPWAAVRYSLLHGLVDQATLGLRLRRGDHVVEPALARAVPTFDGDSIFNAFAAGPSEDARLTWSWRPRAGRAAGLATRAGAWLRRYHLGGDEAPALAGGGELRARWSAARWSAEADALVDDGWGGRRLGGGLGLGWEPSTAARYGLRGALLALTDDAYASPAALGAADAGAQAGAQAYGSALAQARWILMDGVAVHAVVEALSGPTTPLQARALGVLDLQFLPDT